jgi:hypothetical protein
MPVYACDRQKPRQIRLFRAMEKPAACIENIRYSKKLTKWIERYGHQMLNQ